MQRVGFIDVEKLTPMSVFCTRCVSAGIVKVKRLMKTKTGTDVMEAAQRSPSRISGRLYHDVLCTVNDNRFCFVYVAFMCVVDVCGGEHMQVWQMSDLVNPVFIY